MNEILREDLEYVYERLHTRENFRNSSILITGCAGFIGFYLMNFFTHFAKDLGIKSIIALDNFMLRRPQWIKDLEQNSDLPLIISTFDIVNDDIRDFRGINDVDYVFHLASIASPHFYRKYPIETLDSNVWGLRSLLEFFRDKPLKGLLFFSSSEIYGDPAEDQIPTDEEYRGNVSVIGPRSCYDEAKRFGETMSYLFYTQHKVPIRIVRPFNNYGPGMFLNDRRLPPDFANAVFNNKDLAILSDGSPTRTFCYIADAICGYLKAITHYQFDYFNIGIDKPEISISEFAQIFEKHARDIIGYDRNIIFKSSNDNNYLTHNPQRRCPNIKKARELLLYSPEILVDQGVGRFLKFLNHCDTWKQF